MGGMTLGGISLPNGAAFDVLTARIDRQEQDDAVLPETLVPLAAADASQAVNANQPRPFVIAMGAPMMWTINGRTYEMGNVGADERVKLGTTEIWEFANLGGMGGMGGRVWAAWAWRIQCTFTVYSSASCHARWMKPNAQVGKRSARALSTKAGKTRCWSCRVNGRKS